MNDYVCRKALRDALYDADAITMDGVRIINQFPAADIADVLRDQWVSVEDRFPELIPCSAGTEYSEAVVVLTSGRKAMIAIWDGVDFLCAASYWDAEGEQITHWMPLPEPPEEVMEKHELR